MYEPGTGNEGPTVEVMGDLGQYVAYIDETTSQLEAAIINHVENPGNPSALFNAAIGHTIAIKDLLQHIFVRTTDYSNEDAAGMAAHILRNDDKERVKFLQQITPENDSRAFHFVYSETDEERKAIEQLLTAQRDANPDDCVSILIGQHAEFIQGDIHTFLGTELIQARVAKIQRKQQIREHLLRTATTATGVVIGGLLLKTVWDKINPGKA